MVSFFDILQLPHFVISNSEKLTHLFVDPGGPFTAPSFSVSPISWYSKEADGKIYKKKICKEQGKFCSWLRGFGISQLRIGRFLG